MNKYLESFLFCVDLTWNEDIEENQESLEISLGNLINQMRSGGPLLSSPTKKCHFENLQTQPRKKQAINFCLNKTALHLTFTSFYQLNV